MRTLKVVKTMSENVNAITHTAPHHADEVFSTAMLTLITPLVLLRTRDQDLIDSVSPNIIVYDVGGKYIPENKRFDHHQKGFAEKNMRQDGTIYSSAGLIWKQYGPSIVKELGKEKIKNANFLNRVIEHIDSTLIKEIDAWDNGQISSGNPASISALIGTFNPLWNENEEADDCFKKAVEIANTILERKIMASISQIYGEEIVKEKIKKAEGQVLVLDQYISGWQNAVLTSDNPKANQLLYTVYPAMNGCWNIQSIPPSEAEKMGQRKPMPKEWRCLRDDDLAKVTQVETAVFCHANGFIAAAKTKKDALKIAFKAVNA